MSKARSPASSLRRILTVFAASLWLASAFLTVALTAYPIFLVSLPL
ncbi:MAG: hypothetical protein JNK33_01825 [Candidatus Doudnabacteria bacterium]|nr:hypothetical protein [Candidatus Doudnabacteria bacterium]